ncbi:MAG: hypothetical protein GXX96_18770 [Planctomycetaceae bacterium]|nr:hypothetical protein [Planctomycetaceae bacterium]
MTRYITPIQSLCDWLNVFNLGHLKVTFIENRYRPRYETILAIRKRNDRYNGTGSATEGRIPRSGFYTRQSNPRH